MMIITVLEYLRAKLRASTRR